MAIRLKLEIIPVIIILCYLVATYQRNMIWVNEFILWKDNTAKSPLKARAHINLGIEYNEKGQTQKALQVLKKALELKPKNALIYNNFGTVYTKMKHYQNALKLNPSLKTANLNLADIYAQKVKDEKKSQYYLKQAELLRTDRHHINNER